MTRGVDEMQECQTQAFSEHAENQVLFAVIDFQLKINFSSLGTPFQGYVSEIISQYQNCLFPKLLKC